MRKVYSFLMMAVMALVMSFTANAASVTINIDDPNRVSVMLNWEEQTLVAGDNTFDLTVGQSSTIYISPKTGAMIKSVTNASGTPSSTWDGTYYLYEYPIDESYSMKYIVTSVSLEDSRTASCTVNVDNVDNIGGLERSQTNERVELVNGANTVKFIPDMESPLMLSAPYGVTYYKVAVDGVEVAENNGTWYLYVNDGSVVDIQTEYPDVDVVVNVAFANEESKEALTGILVDGTEVTPDADGNFTVKMGKQVTLMLDNMNYAISAFTINGTTPSDYYTSQSEYTFVVKEASNIVLDAHKYGTLKATITIDNPQCVEVTDYYGQPIALVAGDNEIEVSEMAASIRVKKVTGCKITSVLVNGEEASSYGYDDSYGTTIYINADDTKIVITAHEIVYDYSAKVIIDEPCYSYSSITYAHNYESVYLAQGENIIKFNEGENNFRLYVMTTDYNAPMGIYHNGVYVTNYSSSTWTLANGDVINVYMNNDPGVNVTFDVAADLAETVVVKVAGKEYANWAEGVKVAAGTKVAVETAGNVYVNGVATTGEFAVNANTTVIVAAATVVSTPAAGTANPFAYGLKSEIVDGKLNATFALNTDATAVTVKVLNEAGEEVATAEGATAKAEQTVAIDILSLPYGTYTWAVEVAGTEKTNVEYFGDKGFWHPRGVDVDNNMESPAFGNVYVTEGITVPAKDIYWSHQGGGVGLYIFTPDMQGVKNEVTGKYAFFGDVTYNQPTNGADFARVRVAEDGRIFIGRCNNMGDYILYAPSQEDLVKNNKWTSLLVGGSLNSSTYEYYVGEDYLSAPVVGLDVKGSGDNLKLMTIGANASVYGFNNSASRADEYALGTAEALPVPTKFTPLSGYTIAPMSANVDYDNEGGAWYCQGRSKPTSTVPALVYVDANGETKYFDATVARGGGGVRVSPDGKQLAASSGYAKNDRHFTIYDIKRNENGDVLLIANTKINHGIGQNLNDIAWDLAGNIYAVSNSGELVRGYALPRTEAFTTKAATKYAFVVDESTAIEEIEAEEAEVEYYNLQGVKVENPEKGIFIKKQGNKATKVIL